MVRVHLLHPFAVVLEQEGVSRDELLKTAGVPHLAFEDSNAGLSYEQAGQFLRAAISRTRHLALGLEASKLHDAAQLHLLEYFVASSPRFETAIADLIRHQNVFTDTRVLSVEARGDDILLRYAAPTPRPRVIIEYVLGSLLLAAERSLGVEPRTNAALRGPSSRWASRIPCLDVHARRIQSSSARTSSSTRRTTAWSFAAGSCSASPRARTRRPTRCSRLSSGCGLGAGRVRRRSPIARAA